MSNAQKEPAAAGANQPPEPQPPIQQTSLKQFLENTPPGVDVLVSGCITRARDGNEIVNPNAVFLECNHPDCKGKRWFDTEDYFYPEHGKTLHRFITFTCRHCTKTRKHYSLIINGIGDKCLKISKIGELPEMGGSLPPKLITLFRESKDFLQKGYKAELKALGIGAFAYYRRVIENQKAKIFEAIIKACTRLNADPELLAELETAKGQNQFKNSVESIRHALPPGLSIDGHNPLTLLHDALSDGIHNKSDEECLALATAIRIVMTGLTERIDTILKEDKVLTEAVNALVARTNKQKQK